MFLAALRDILIKTVRTSDALIAADHLQKKIKISSTFGSSYSTSDKGKYKLLVGLEIEEIFRAMIYDVCQDIRSVKPRNPAEKRVLDAYMVFHRRLKDTLSRPNLNSQQSLGMADRILSKINGIEYIDIRVTNKEVAYNLFESHNAKGVALAKTDLIKNYYFGRLSGSDSEKNRRMDEWDSLLNEFSDNTSNMQPDRFFYYMLQSYEGNFSSSNLYRRIKPWMQNHQGFFNLLKKNVKLMVELKNADTGDKEINRILTALNEKLRVNQCFILLLCLYRNKEKLSPPIYKKIFQAVEDFTYIYSGVTKSPSHALEKVYSRHAKELEDMLREDGKDMSKVDKEKATGRLLKRLREDLRELMPNYGVFLEAFGDLRYTSRTNKVIIKYTFEKIELHHSKGIILLGDSFTLDHIIPQRKAKEGFYQSIGNLTPMSQARNSAKGHSPAMQDNYLDINNFYTVKKLNEQLANGRSFDEKDINTRLNYLAKYAYYEAFSAVSRN